MDKVEILLEINKLNRDINSLNTNKTKYQNMNIKINDTVSKLEKVNGYLYTSYRELEKNYSSSEAKKKVTSLKSESGEVESIINELNGTILTESYRKINSINYQIGNKESRKQQLRNQLNNMA